MISLYPVLTLLFAPVTTFRSLTGRSKDAWIPPFLICGLCSMAIAWGTGPVIQTVIERHYPILQTDLPPRIGNAIIVSLSHQPATRLVIAPLRMLVVWLMYAGLLRLLLRSIHPRVDYSAILMVVGYAGIVVSLGDLLNLLNIYWHGVQYISSPLTMSGDFGVHRLFDPKSMAIESLFRGVSIFSLWRLMLLIIGLSIVGSIDIKKAIIVSIITWASPLFIYMTVLSFIDRIPLLALSALIL